MFVWPRTHMADDIIKGLQLGLKIYSHYRKKEMLLTFPGKTHDPRISENRGGS